MAHMEKTHSGHTQKNYLIQNKPFYCNNEKITLKIRCALYYLGVISIIQISVKPFSYILVLHLLICAAACMREVGCETQM